VVRRPEPRYRAGVVLVIDAAAGTGAAVEFAFDEAAGRGCELTAVRVVDRPTGTAPAADPVLSAALGGWPDKYPQVELLRRVPVDRNRLRAFLEESAHAELVVIGGGSGPIAGGLLAHAGTAVAVVPG